MTQEIVILYLIGCVGMLSHWAKRYARLETVSTLYEYLLVVNRKHTAAAFASFTVSFVMLLQTGIDVAGIEAALAAFTLGYTIDSSVNKDAESVTV